MQFAVATYGLGFVAGAASVLSPCVLPLLPILATSALAKHRFGIVALAGGWLFRLRVLAYFSPR